MISKSLHEVAKAHVTFPSIETNRNTPRIKSNHLRKLLSNRINGKTASIATVAHNNERQGNYLRLPKMWPER